MHRQTSCLALCALFALPSLAAAQSASRPAFNKEGAYAGVSVLPKFTFDDDNFDGQSTYQELDGDEFAILPKLSTAALTRFQLGYRTKRVGLEVGYDWSGHDATFRDATGDVTYKAINFDARWFFIPEQRIQPYVQFGGTMPWLTVPDGSFLNEQVGDAKFKGLGLNAQVGVLVYPHRRLGISAGYNYHRVAFETVKGVSDTEFDLIPKFTESRNLLIVGGHFVF